MPGLRRPDRDQAPARRNGSAGSSPGRRTLETDSCATCRTGFGGKIHGGVRAWGNRMFRQEKSAFSLEREAQQTGLRRVAVVGNYLPRQCGIATFTTDLCEAIASEFRQ